ncbi:hypothetical protein GIB67_029615 [Kingdonia uniflora]|uniref:Large ribosomal subunit protein bL12 C-terminal domain-containing protein n=1 Tax=Kingdonia uniflora TaxID=39325 RepID=A0A7J7LLB6_9MAGN|nr:hypothetical protein GIB67_029615 [Kingdonia uniflora]
MRNENFGVFDRRFEFIIPVVTQYKFISNCIALGLSNYGPSISGLASSLSGTSSALGSTGEDAKAIEKTTFDIKLEKFDVVAMIKIIKEVRPFTDLGLKEAKELVEKIPVVLKSGVTKEVRNPIIKKLKELGATIVLE